MHRHLVYSVLSLMVITTVVLVGANLCFTYPYFNAMELHTLSLDLMTGALTPEQALRTDILGYYPMEREITHLMDVGALVEKSRLTLLWLAPLTLFGLYYHRNHLLNISTWAFGWFMGITAGLGAVWATNSWWHASNILHGLFFEKGSWHFEHGALILRLYNRDTMIEGALFISAFSALILLALLVKSTGRTGTPKLKSTTVKTTEELKKAA